MARFFVIGTNKTRFSYRYSARKIWERLLNRILAENVSNILTNSPDDMHNLTSYYDDDFLPMNELHGTDLGNVIELFNGLK